MLSCTNGDNFNREFPQVEMNTISEISSEGVNFEGKLSAEFIKEITEYGFIWSDDLTKLEQKTFIKSSTKKLESNNFSLNIKSTLHANTKYYAKAYVKHQGLNIYSKTIEFESKGSIGPIITDLYPKSGNWGDTITIKGENFDYSNRTTYVMLGTISQSIVKLTDSIIKFKVRETVKDGNLKLMVQISDFVTESNLSFVYKIPEIISISTNTFKLGDIIQINYRNIGKTNNVYVFIDDISAQKVEVTKEYIKFKIPTNISNPNPIIKIKTDGRYTESITCKLIE
jgi:hypothetical protein